MEFRADSLGRSIPCELRDEWQITRWDNVAPRCDAMHIERIYPLCPVLEQADRVEREVPAAKADSVRAMGQPSRPGERTTIDVIRDSTGRMDPFSCLPVRRY